MERLKRTLSFRKKKTKVPECQKPHQWQEDEKKVRDGTCSFQVRYLGCLEVFESRGMHVCEEAVKVLKASYKERKRKSSKLKFWKAPNEQCKGKYQRAVLYVSGDALRVVDEISKKSTQGLIVDQTIEKVSFCAPDRHHEKGFAYICRDGTTRRWLCHGFLALKESGERLSHAVGCAFTICLERKQKREKETVQVEFNQKGTTFSRMGSFRATTITERIADPQSAIIAEPVPQTQVVTPFAVQRPHAKEDMLLRQGSFRGFSKLQDASSPFKRQMSLRLNELPSNIQRQQNFVGPVSPIKEEESPRENGHEDVAWEPLPNQNPGRVSPIPEASPTKENENPDAIASMCQELTQGLSALNSADPFAKTTAPLANNQHQPSSPANQVFTATVHQTPTRTTQQSPAMPQATPVGAFGAQPVRQTNPWSTPPPPVAMAPHTPPTQTTPQKQHGHQRKLSDAEFWLETAQHTAAQAASSPAPAHAPVNHPAGVNGSALTPQQQQYMAAQQQQQQRAVAPPIGHIRSHSIDSGESYRKPTLKELSSKSTFHANFQSVQNGTSSSGMTTAAWPGSSRSATDSFDPFDVAWAAKAQAQKKAEPAAPNTTMAGPKPAFTVQL
ncbi:unnamed protein product [Owenia fusiformis]|uniref:PID domain-containing protein n=1 Tax=Owenia fusiformis TaxID=6347 RepID=A0A8S4PLB1_OWEFU|nr:unnamed protein product [Owenia fusiformis]